MTEKSDPAALDSRCLQAEAKLANAMRYLDEIRITIRAALAMRYPNHTEHDYTDEECRLLKYLLGLTR